MSFVIDVLTNRALGLLVCFTVDSVTYRDSLGSLRHVPAGSVRIEALV